MNNFTSDMSRIKNIFRRYLLGESLKNIFIRFLFILLIIILIWSCLMLILILYIKYRRRKQIEDLLLENTLHSQLNSSLTSVSSIKVNSISRILPQMKQKWLCWTRTNKNDLRYDQNKSASNANKTQVAIGPISRRPFFIQRNYSTYQNDHELQCAETYSNNPTMEVPVYAPHHFSSDDNSNESPSTKMPLLFHPTTCRFSTNDNHLSTNPNRSFTVSSSTQDFIIKKRRHSSTDHPQRHLPLVMITDTNSSYTNILELETFEDKHRLLTNSEKRLILQLKASYPPRHST